MPDAVKVEISLPKEEIETALQKIFLDKSLPCEPLPMEPPPEYSLEENVLSEENRRSLDALRKALRILEEIETMGRVAVTGRRITEEMPPLEKLAVLVKRIYSNEWDAVEETEFISLKGECIKRLRLYEAMASGLRGQCSAVFRLEVPSKNLQDLEVLVSQEGERWVMRNLGASEMRAQGGWLSRLVRSKK